MRILVDMDGVIADFEKSLLEEFRRRHPTELYVALEDRTAVHAEDDYPEETQHLIREIYQSKGFYLSLPPIPGGLEALTELQKKNQVFICTSPLTEYHNCVLEKYEWVDRYLGSEWVRKIRMVKDKTIDRADFLIDDRSKIKGVDTPSWEHIIYDQPYNRDVTTKRRLTWENWREVLRL